MDNYLETDARINFKKGMTLSEYMQEMKPDDNQITQGQMPQTTQDLYETCFIHYERSPSTKLIPFNIPEMDEDNYESSVDFTPETPGFNVCNEQTLNAKCSRGSSKKQFNKTPIQVTTMYNPHGNLKTESTKPSQQQSKQYRIKHFSNSPFKRQQELTPTKNSLSKTLYGNTFLSNNMSTASSTLYQSKLFKVNQKAERQQSFGHGNNKGTIHSKQSKNEKYFQQKNKRDLDNMIQYENSIRLKYNSKINVFDIRVDGFKDKLYQRKNKLFH